MMHRLRTPLRAFCALAVLAAVPEALDAQSRVRGTIDAEVRWSQVAGATRRLVGADLWLALGDRIRFGGGAWALPTASRSGTLGGSGLELDFGYGGVGVEWIPPVSDVLSVRALFGAGSGTTFDRATGTRIDSEGFFLFEPTVGLALPVVGPLSLVGDAGWRFTWGVDDLTRVDPDDLDAWVVGVGVRIGPF